MIPLAVTKALQAAQVRTEIPARYQLEAARNAHRELVKLDAAGAAGTPRALAVALRLLDLIPLERLEAHHRQTADRNAARAAAAGRARSAAVDYNPTAVRAWARETGRPCPARGRYLPPELVEAYREAIAS